MSQKLIYQKLFRAPKPFQDHVCHFVTALGVLQGLRRCLIASKLVFLLVNGGWCEWYNWGPCNSVTGKRKRTRGCNNPPPQNGGAYCSGSSYDEEYCTGIRYYQAKDETFTQTSDTARIAINLFFFKQHPKVFSLGNPT